MTTSVADRELLENCHERARSEGLAPALFSLATTALPGLLPCGPAGHILTDIATYERSTGIWSDGRARERDTASETRLDTLDVPGGAVVLATTDPPAPSTRADQRQRVSFGLGLVWLRLGLSERLRADCVRHLSGRTAGDTPLLHQQLVKGTVAEVLAEQLEVRAVLQDAGPAGLPAATLGRLHRRVTAADRAQVRLLGASGYLVGSPGMTAYVSELLAEAHVAPEVPA